jgi:hypothetical protein
MVDPGPEDCTQVPARGEGGHGPAPMGAAHPAEWKRLVEIAPLKRRASEPT